MRRFAFSQATCRTETTDHAPQTLLQSAAFVHAPGYQADPAAHVTDEKPAEAAPRRYRMRNRDQEETIECGSPAHISNG